MSLLGSLFERRGADPTAEWGSSRIPTNGEAGGVSPSGAVMNEDSAMKLAMVYTCVGILADGVSTLDFHSYVKTGDRTKRMVDPEPFVVSDPWPEGTAQDWKTQVMYSLTLRGNFYGLITDRDRRGYAETIMPVHPDRVLARRNTVTGKREYRIGGELQKLDDIFHIPALLAPGQFIGMNPIEYMRNSWGLAATAEGYGAAFFRNSANPSGVISVPDDLAPNEVLEMARAWKAAHQGVGAAQLPAVLTGGATWQQMSINPDDAQFIATRVQQNTDILGFFRIPPSMVGLSDKASSWGTGLEQAEISYNTNTLGAWYRRIENYLTKIRPPGEIVRADLSQRLRGDTLQRFNAYTLGRNGGWLSDNDIRAKEDMEGIGPDGDVYWTPMNFAPISKVLDGSMTPVQGGSDSGTGGIGGGLVNDPNAPAPGVDTDKITQ